MIQCVRASVQKAAAAGAAGVVGSLALTSLAAAGAGGGGDTITVVSSLDNTIVDNGNASGIGQFVFTGRNGGLGGAVSQRALIRFDLEGVVPDGATIVDAVFTLSLVQGAPGSGDQTHTVHRLLQSWGEGESAASGGGGSPPETDDATWTSRFHPVMPWTNAGGDFVPTPSATMDISAAPMAINWTGPGIIADVESWIDDPATNHGFIVIGNEASPQTARKFYSHESTFVAGRPMLSVTYETGGTPCTGNTDGDDIVGFNDLLSVLASFGPCPGGGEPCPADVSGDGGVVDFQDLLIVLSNWGPCP